MSKALAALLLLGTLLLLGAGAMHPVLPLTGPGDLALIGGMAHWRTVHLVLLYATGLCIAGIWARWLTGNALERPSLAAAFVLFGLGMALNGVNIAFMTGAGTYFAVLFEQGIRVSNEIYQAMHLFAVMTGRLGGFLISLAAGIIALSTRAGGQDPRWLIRVAGVAAIAGLLGNLLAPAGHPLMLVVIGVLGVWQVVTAIRILRSPAD
jgi:hypothetical protein